MNNKVDMSAPCAVGDFVTFTGFKLAAGDTAPVELAVGTKLKVTNTDSWAEQQLLEVEMPTDTAQILSLYAGEFETIAKGHETGDIVKFLGYAEPLDENILKEGDVVTITDKQKDEDGYTFIVALLSDPSVKESLFDTEIAALTEKEIKDATKKTKKKAAAKPKRKKATKKVEAVSEVEASAKVIAKVEDKAVAETPPSVDTSLAVSRGVKLAPIETQELTTDIGKVEVIAVAPKSGEGKEIPTDRKLEPVMVSDKVKGAGIDSSAGRNTVSIISSTFSLAEVVGDEATAIHAVHSLSENINDSFYVMGGVLSAIYDKQYYVSAGFKSFDDYVKGTLESGVWPIGVRTAKYLVNIFRTFDALGYTLDSIKASGLGWSKLKDIARVDYMNEEKFPSSEDADKVARQLIDFAKDHNGDELREQVKAVMDKGSSVTIGKEIVRDDSETREVWQARFKLGGAEGETMQQAMDASKAALKATGQVAGDDEAIYYMTSQWLLNDSNVELPKEQVIAGVCQRYGISLIEKGEAEYTIEDGEVKITELK